jgi:methylmalonyl-CoA/ethylmalonyl-CoA epimerase
MINAKGINHIGIAVRSIADHHAYYEQTLGAEFEGVECVPSQQVKAAFFRLGCVRLELLEPTGLDSPIARFLDKRGEGVHHIAFSVDDLEARIAELQSGGVRMIDDRPRPGAHHMQIAFLHPASTGGVLTELCEPAPHAEPCRAAAGSVPCR